MGIQGLGWVRRAWDRYGGSRVGVHGYGGPEMGVKIFGWV